jgi:hypothetical protein
MLRLLKAHMNPSRLGTPVLLVMLLGQQDSKFSCNEGSAPLCLVQRASIVPCHQYRDTSFLCLCLACMLSMLLGERMSAMSEGPHQSDSTCDVSQFSCHAAMLGLMCHTSALAMMILRKLTSMAACAWPKHKANGKPGNSSSVHPGARVCLGLL